MAKRTKEEKQGEQSSMPISERAEEILENLWIELVEKKEKLSDSRLLHDDDGFKQLVDNELIKINKKGHVSLTSEGKEEARGCIRRHRLAERLISDIFVLKDNLIHETGCQFEHLLKKGLDTNICTLLGHPRKCPHGKEIPEGECCKENKLHPDSLTLPLTEIQVNKKSDVTHLQTENRDTLQKLIAMGVLPGAEIILKQKSPSFVFAIGRSNFAVDKELASHIYVKYK